MWIAPEVDRAEVPDIAAERPMLQGWLDFHRTTLLWKCAGLSGEELVVAAAPPSNLTLLGLVRHMTEVERTWFRRRVGGQDINFVYGPGDQDFEEIDAARAAADVAALRAEWVAADAAVAYLPLGFEFRRGDSGARMSLRWVYVHLIEEYARHNGHADLIRERIDGTVGD